MLLLESMSITCMYMYTAVQSEGQCTSGLMHMVQYDVVTVDENTQHNYDTPKLTGTVCSIC